MKKNKEVGLDQEVESQEEKGQNQEAINLGQGADHKVENQDLGQRMSLHQGVQKILNQKSMYKQSIYRPYESET